MLIFSSVGHRDKHRIQNQAGGSSLFSDLRLKQGKGNSCQLSKLFKVVLLALAGRSVQKGQYPISSG